jgi:hypothetical protein
MRKFVIIASALVLASCGKHDPASDPVDTTLPENTSAIGTPEDNMLVPADENAMVSDDLNAAANDAINEVNAAVDNAAADANPYLIPTPDPSQTPDEAPSDSDGQTNQM